MKVKDGFIKNKVGSQYVVVPVGEMSIERHCMLRLNGTGAFLWDQLKTHATMAALVDALQETYEVSAETAEKDVAEFLNTLRNADLLDD